MASNDGRKVFFFRKVFPREMALWTDGKVPDPRWTIEFGISFGKFATVVNALKLIPSQSYYVEAKHHTDEHLFE